MAYTFANASSQYLSHAAAVVSALPVTLACWFRPDTPTGAARGLLCVANNGGGEQIAIRSGDTTNARFLAISTNSAFTSAFSSTAGNVSNGTWQHGAGVFATTTSRIAYLDGVAATENTTSNVIGNLDTTLIGATSSVTPNNFYNGDIAEAAVWSVALTAEEIASLAKAFSPLLIRPASLVAYWPLIGNLSPETAPKGGFDMTLNAAPTKAAHCRIIQPRRAA